MCLLNEESHLEAKEEVNTERNRKAEEGTVTMPGFSILTSPKTQLNLALFLRAFSGDLHPKTVASRLMYILDISHLLSWLNLLPRLLCKVHLTSEIALPP
jgi:hypothetical protein